MTYEIDLALKTTWIKNHLLAYQKVPRRFVNAVNIKFGEKEQKEEKACRPA